MASTQQMYGKITPPIETKVAMDKDYDYYIAKYNAQPPPPPPPRNNSKYQGNLGVLPMEPVVEQPASIGTPPRHPTTVSPTGTPGKSSENSPQSGKLDVDEALMDLAQLEELHHEAERMKALGNKHMAAQEYTRAYNAYSAALQLSPVGPSSHVFLSNRSAALLSLKRYSAAATDARRAIALAPTFGKAHARLGQSLYFLKDYEGAVAAYEEAIHYEPDNPITRTYLEKAKTKLHRHREKVARASRGEELSVLTTDSSVQQTVVNSIATDPNASAAVVQTMGFRGQSNIMTRAVSGAMKNRGLGEHSLPSDDEDDPDFDEAIRIQERANRYLANKSYKYAIEEYTAALFLVPDDDNLSPDLHLGRAHALNGSRRHESAMIDAKLAIKIKPTPEAYSTLAKSYFYMQDYEGSIDTFMKCKNMLPEGESLSMFDRAYLQKAEAAMQQQLLDGNPRLPASPPKLGHSAPIPKLKPPRFVPREQALNRTPNMPSMPKAWPQQSPRASQVLQCGPEREVLFLSEALGIKLNRGPDGTVRVIDVSPEVPGSPIARQGKIEVGDVIREAAGVDIRRPITNIMWGDTVALIKMAPRPIVLVVAKELSPAPSIAQQRKQAAANALSPTSSAQYFPSNSSGDESVRQQMEKTDVITSDPGEETQGTVPDTTDASVNESAIDRSEGDECNTNVVSATDGAPDKIGDFGTEPNVSGKEASRDAKEKQLDTTVDDAIKDTETQSTEANKVDSSTMEESRYEQETAEVEIPSDVGLKGVAVSPPVEAKGLDEKPELSLRDDELQRIGGEVFFKRDNNPKYHGWDNLRWMAYAGTRKVAHCEIVARFAEGRRSLFWSDEYLTRKLAIYDDPNLILVLRVPDNLAELKEIMDLPVGAKIEDPDTAFKAYLVVESVVDPVICKLRLSPLTTATSILPDVKEDDFRRRSCFELINPVESVILSAVRLRTGAERALTSFSDSGAFLETSTIEHILRKFICNAHKPSGENSDLSWKHQIILGTLHSFVVLGNQSFLDLAIAAALRSTDGAEKSNYLDSRIIDGVDESGRTPLHYACSSRFSSAVASLVKAGANVDLRIEPYNMTPCHICAKNLDNRSLAAVLSINKRPNVVDSWGRTPMYLSITEGRTVGGQGGPDALDRCLAVLESYGGEMEGAIGFRHPISYLSSIWRHEELSAVLKHVNYRYPLILRDANDKKRIGMSVSAFYQYPVHSSLITLRKRIKSASEGQNVQQLWTEFAEPDNKLIKTLQILFKCGFEPNERLEGLLESFDGFDELAIHVGFAPIQIVAAAALDVSKQKDLLGETLYMSIMGFIANVCETLVKNGARLSLEEPPAVRCTLRSSSSIVDCSNGSEEGNDDVQAVDRSDLKIHSNKPLADLLGAYRLNSAEMVWGANKSAKSTGSFIFHTDKLAIEDSEAPGGSDEKSCAICWKKFGKLMNRKHRCRISRRHACDECSSKRVIGKDGEEHRVSDGQFLLARSDEADEESKQLEAAKREGIAKQSQNSTAARLDRLEADERANRDSLFGGVMESMSKAVFGGDAEETEESHASNIEGLSSQLNQTRDALNERGDKLNTLAEKSDKLVNASKDFEAMARELNKNSNQGFFW